MKRRTEGVLKGGRQERVVDAVLRATAETLSQDGYAGLRVEDVAARSGVNKTTIYRRWPTKPDLVAAALDTFRMQTEPPDSGRLRDDLVAVMRELVRFAMTPTGRGLVRMLQIERSDPEVEKISRELRTRQRTAWVVMIERAIARGELPASADPGLLYELLLGPLFARLATTRGERPDGAFIEEIIDTVLAGLRARAGAREDPQQRR